jgi:hypothetical protein
MGAAAWKIASADTASMAFMGLGEVHWIYRETEPWLMSFKQAF